MSATQISMKSAVEKAVRYLVEAQEPTGSWRDFDIPLIGASDDWVTAYVGNSLLDASGFVSRDLSEPIERAGTFLSQTFHDRNGWGYNGKVPRDCDSTAWALIFLSRTRNDPPDAHAMLAAYQRSDGGFATFNDYPPQSAWTHSHVDVTAVALKALISSGAKPDSLTAGIEYLLKSRGEAGYWESYWYSTSLYSTVHVLDVLKTQNRSDALNGLSTAYVESQVDANDPFVLAHAYHLANQLACRELESAFLERLLSLQRIDGRWAAKRPFMRLTDQGIADPWRYTGDGAGPLLYDTCALFTTSTVVQTLMAAVR